MMKSVRWVLVIVGIAVLLFAGWRFATIFTSKGAVTGAAQEPLMVGLPARPRPVDGTKQNSDEFIWNKFVEFVAPVDKSHPSPVIFETWASDKDTFSKTPQWPAPDAPKKFQASVLSAAANSGHQAIDIPCNHFQPPTPAPAGPPPIGGNPAVAGFPSSGCIAEEVKRNRPQFDYIVKKKLNTQAGLAEAYQNSFVVNMPTDAIAVKGDWVPVQILLQWLPALDSIENIRKLYYTNTSAGVEYALLAMHVSSRQNPNWVWGTFEHQMNPGRCDSIGCFDSFGATTALVSPNRTAANTQYGPCPKTKALKDLMAKANVSPVWENYCLKATQVDFTAPDGTPYVLGNSVIEGIVGNGTIAASSCIGCHAYASFGADGAPTYNASAMLPFNPSGRPIPGVLNDAVPFDFMWGVLLAP